MYRSKISLVGLLVATSFAADAMAEHPVPIITANVYVNRTKTTMQLSFFAEDLATLQGLEPNAKGIYERPAIVESFAVHRQFLLDNIQLRDVDGNLIPGKIVDFNDSDVPADGIESAMLMNYSLGMSVEYSYERLPEVLTISHDVSDPNFIYPTEMSVVVKQAGRDEPQAVNLKPTIKETFRFDWANLPPTENAPEADWKKWFDEQREKDLGIASYSSTYSFLYITRYEVRNEILVPLASLPELKIDKKNADFLEIDEQDAVKPQVEKHFADGVPIRIDGIAVKPIVDRIDFYGADVKDFVRRAERRRVSLANGRVGIMLRYPVKTPPQEVLLTWNVLSDVLRDVELIAFPFDEVTKTKFGKYLPTNDFVWKNPGTPPLPKLTEIERRGHPISQPSLYFCAGAAGALLLGIVGIFSRRNPMAIASGIALAACLVLGWQAQARQWPKLVWPREKVSNETARDIFEQLHKNIFRAFDYNEDADIYDALAASVDGSLLRDLHLQILARLKMSDQGGARSRIDEVKFLDGNLDATETAKMSQGFAVRCKWNLVGSVEHWGHIHQRSIVYEGVFRVEPRDRAWKITAMDITNEEPPQIKTSIRRL
jgi:hypothetical protein